MERSKVQFSESSSSNHNIYSIKNFAFYLVSYQVGRPNIISNNFNKIIINVFQNDFHRNLQNISWFNSFHIRYIQSSSWQTLSESEDCWSTNKVVTLFNMFYVQLQ